MTCTLLVPALSYVTPFTHQLDLRLLHKQQKSAKEAGKGRTNEMTYTPTKLQFLAELTPGIEAPGSASKNPSITSSGSPLLLNPKLRADTLATTWPGVNASICMCPFEPQKLVWEARRTHVMVVVVVACVGV
jgi:hypothetical protein